MAAVRKLETKNGQNNSYATAESTDKDLDSNQSEEDLLLRFEEMSNTQKDELVRTSKTAMHKLRQLHALIVSIDNVQTR